MGLGVENWTVEQCIGKFTSLCGDAFTPRELLKVPLLGKLSTVNHRSMYKTQPFEKALQEAFEDRPLFGGLNSQEGHMIKVAVTSTTLMDQQPVVLANYNRPDFQGYSKPDSFPEVESYSSLFRKLQFRAPGQASDGVENLGSVRDTFRQYLHPANEDDTSG